MTDDKPTPPPTPDQVPTGNTGDSKPKPQPPIVDTVPTGNPGSTAITPEMK